MERIGVISDTHNLLRPEAVQVLTGCALLLHAGDICNGTVLEQLQALAPVIAVRGNNDRHPTVSGLPETAEFEFAGHKGLVVHDLHSLSFNPVEAGYSVVVSGHSHRPYQTWRNSTLYFNPGSAGPRRFKLPVTVGILSLQADRWHSEIVALPI